MIISASRRTDIPALYSDWFFNRLKEGFVLTRNPVNRRQVNRISLTPDNVDGFCFWTKNPAAMLGRLNELSSYEYYFQFTITPYGADIEPNLPDKRVVVETFKKLSGTIGPDRVVLRYDPILINKKYHAGYHPRAFEKLTRELRDHTRRVTISFIGANYRGVRANINELDLTEITDEEKFETARSLAEIAAGNGLVIDSCAGKLGLERFGIGPARCVDSKYFSKTRGGIVERDKNQRPECRCAKSVDIGAYNTCVNGCRYCYANYIKRAAADNYAEHDPASPFISG